MGLAGLTAVFGMGTGVTPPVWSPEIARPAVRPGRAVDGRSRRIDHTRTLRAFWALPTTLTIGDTV